ANPAVGEDGAYDFDRIARQIDTESFTIQRLELPEQLPDRFSFSIALDGVQMEIRLRKGSVRGPDFGLKIQERGGAFADAKPGPVRTYTGFVLGDSGALATATLVESGMIGKVFLRDGSVWNVQPLRQRDAHAHREEHVVYREGNVHQPELI
ncbi:MAG: hypothetical protein ABIK28_07280, partial [Planctomycetota bacterium]